MFRNVGKGDKMESLSLIGMLGILSVEDIKSHKVRDILVLSFALIGVLMHVIFQRIGTFDVIGGMGTGVAVLIISKSTGEKIGIGDGLVLMLTGIFLGFWRNIALIWISTTFLAIYGGIMIMAKKKGKDDRIPFIPFLMAGSLLMLIVGKGSIS